MKSPDLSGTNAPNEDIQVRVDAYIDKQAQLDLLRFITCGSVDDGKSTLIGRMLFEAQLIFEDQITSLESDSKKVGTQGGDIDFALLVDGLAAEREQGITIDVAYRFFNTDRRKFIVADTPGHEQYTRNMVTGASTADVAIILVDASQGIMTQTRRHSFIASLLGIQHVVLAVNKMDLVDYSNQVFDEIILALAQVPLLLKIMSVCPLPNLDLERGISSIRSYLLCNMSEICGTSSLFIVQSAIALQCFTNEYIYDLTSIDSQALEGLDRSVTKTLSNGEQPKPQIYLTLV